MKQWECFNDPAYFDLWAVRRADKRSFNEAIHVRTESEARFLVSALNELERLRDERKTQMAERLSKFEEWARSMCRSECGLLLARYGRHAPNCPAKDLGINQEGDQ